MARKLSFTIEVEGAAKVVSELADVNLELDENAKRIKEVKKSIDIFKNGTDDQIAALQAEGKSLQGLETRYASLLGEQTELRIERNKLNKEIRDQAKAFDLVKDSVPDTSLIGLRQRYKELRKEIDLMDASARKSVKGLEKIKEADGIKKQIDEIGESVGDFRSQVGSYAKAFQSVIGTIKGGGGVSAIIDPVANILGTGGGGLVGTLVEATKILGPFGVALTGALGGIAAIGTYTAQVTLEFEKLNNQVGTITGLFGTELQAGVVGVKALADTFQKDFNEVLLAANSLTKEVTGDFNKSIDLIRTGFLAGADSSGDFLDSLREYSTQIREAGANGEQFIEILVRAQQEGIYSDKGVDLVKEFGLRIREQTEGTKKALNDAFGEEFTTTLFKGINDGSVSTVDALANVSKELSDTDLTAKQTGQILADVFGGPGEDAGLRFIETLQDVNGELEDLVDPTDAYTQRLNELYDANVQLGIQQSILANQFAGVGTSIETFGTTVKSKGTQLLNEFFLASRIVYRSLRDFENVSSADLIAEDAEAVRKQTAAAAAEQAKYREEVRKGTKGIAALRKEQSELKTEIQNLNLAGKDTTDQLALLYEVNKKIADSSAGLGTALKDVDFDSFRESVRNGGEGIAELRKEQSRLKTEIQDLQVAGKDYNTELSLLQGVNKKIADSTKVLNDGLKKTNDRIKEIAVEGSIEFYSKKVSDLQAQISKAPENKALELIEDLNSAELDLSKAQQVLEDYKESIRDANIDQLPIAEQVEYFAEGIERRRQLQIQAATDRLQTEREIAEQVSLINAEFDIEALENRLKAVDENKAEYFEIINEISAKNKELESLKIDIDIAAATAKVSEAERLLTGFLQKTITNEQELQTRIDLVRTTANAANLQKQLESERLTAEERFGIEQELRQRISEQEALQARVDIDFDVRSDEISDDVENKVAGLIPQFDPENIDASLQAIRDFEEQRKTIELEENIARLELDKELLIQQGEETLEIQNQIDARQLELDQAKNEKLIEQHAARIKQEQDLQKRNQEITTDIISGTADIVSGIFDGTIESGEDVAKAFLKLMLDTVEKIVLLQIASASAQSLAQADSVATFGATGLARTAILSALIKAAFSVAKAGINASLAEGDVIGETYAKGGLNSATRDDLKKGTIFRGKSHAAGGEHFRINNKINEAESGEAIIKKTSTTKWRGLLSAINEDTGGKSFSSDSGQWRDLLLQYKPARYAEGDITGAGNINAANIPQLVNPKSVIVAKASINAEDIAGLSDAISKNIEQAVAEVTDKVIAGLSENNRIAERQTSAISNSEI